MVEIPAQGQSGGIAILWHDSHVQLSHIRLDGQEIHAMIQFMDLGFKGAKYTWSNHRYNRPDLILEQLDRCFINEQWLEYYPNTFVTHLPKTYSDHTPLLIFLSHCTRLHTNRIFRLETYWCQHPEFTSMVRNTWNGQNLTNATTLFTIKVKDWAANNFGDVLRKKKTILARLSGIQNPPIILRVFS
ncbi:uncharacterized protein [Nicotiana sylvestris]|uniref:uncharacterized protein n=1 Tax=Nicotiana sylvestris TaxID=4096 RepID=UPI00388C3FA2